MSAPYDSGLDLIRSELVTGAVELLEAEAALLPRLGRRKLTAVDREVINQKVADARTHIKQWARSAKHRAANGSFETAELLMNTAEAATLKEIFDMVNVLTTEGALR